MPRRLLRRPADQLRSVAGPAWSVETPGGAWAEFLGAAGASRPFRVRRSTAWAPGLASGERGTTNGTHVASSGERGATARSVKLARLEAVLFAADEPLASRRLAQVSGVGDGIEVRRLVRQLNLLYERGRSALRVEEIAGGFQLLTRPELGGWLARWQAAAGETRLSAPALETLAVVAYRQPVLRADVEAIRGVQCGEMLRQLMEKGFVRIAGRHNSLGRPILYGTTKKFLQIFGLKNLGELPMVQELRMVLGAGEATTPDAPSNPNSGSVHGRPITWQELVTKKGVQP